jgi:hypothetical protein
LRLRLAREPESAFTSLTDVSEIRPFVSEGRALSSEEEQMNVGAKANRDKMGFTKSRLSSSSAASFMLL